MLISVVSSIVASLILVMADGIPLIGLANLLFGISASLLMISRQTYVTASSPRYERGRVIAVMAACFRVASLLGPVLGGDCRQFQPGGLQRHRRPFGKGHQWSPFSSWLVQSCKLA